MRLWRAIEKLHTLSQEAVSHKICKVELIVYLAD